MPHVALSPISSASGVQLVRCLRMRACALARRLINDASGTSNFAIWEQLARIHLQMCMCMCACVLPLPCPSRFVVQAVPSPNQPPRLLYLFFRSARALERATALQSGPLLFATTPSAEDDERKKSHQTRREHACVCVCVCVCVYAYVCVYMFAYTCIMTCTPAFLLLLCMIDFALFMFALVNLEDRM